MVETKTGGRRSICGLRFVLKKPSKSSNIWSGFKDKRRCASCEAVLAMLKNHQNFSPENKVFYEDIRPEMSKR